VYVADEQQHLLGVSRSASCSLPKSDKRVRDVMATELVTVGEEAAPGGSRALVHGKRLMAIPVVDVEGRIKGIVTVDDIVDVVQERPPGRSEVRRYGGPREPYLQIALARMIKKAWRLAAALFLGEMLTASAMAFFEERDRARRRARAIRPADHLQRWQLGLTGVHAGDSRHGPG